MTSDISSDELSGEEDEGEGESGSDVFGETSSE